MDSLDVRNAGCDPEGLGLGYPGVSILLLGSNFIPFCRLPTARDVLLRTTAKLIMG